MFQRMKTSPWLTLGAGLAIGLLVGLGMMIGAVAAMQYGRSPELPFAAQRLQASATHGSNTMAIATGPIAEGVEGMFVLDFITGDLQCLVMNPRTGTLAGAYKHNVVRDLGVEQGKQPKYLLVTGAAAFRNTVGGNIRPAESVVYVADANTGNYVAYILPWNRQAASYNFTQVFPFYKIGQGTARNVAIE